MKQTVILAVIIGLIGFAFHTAYAGEEQDAVALAKKAAQFIKENGTQKGFAEITNPGGKLRKGKMGMTANDFAGVCLANAGLPKLVGQNHYTLRDANDRPFMQEAIQIAKTKGTGWIEFSFTNPDTKKIAPMKAWVQRLEGMEAFLMVPIILEKK